METHNKIANLIIKYRKAGLNAQEQRELDEWVGLSNENRRLFERLTDESYLAKLYEIDVRAERKKIKQLYETETGRSFPIGNKKWYYITYGIVFLLVVGSVGKYLFFYSDSKPAPTAGKVKPIPHIPSNAGEFPEIGKEVTLTLPNDSIVSLDKMPKGASFYYSNQHIVKEGEGKLKVLPAAEKLVQNENYQELDVQYSFLNVPRGRTYQLTLPDGSMVWLNSYSSVQFPMSFDPDKRNLKLLGEAYFEIMTLFNGGIKIPFEVDANGMHINVTGTKFNINAYGDEDEVKTTLLEGSIEIVHRNSSKKMIPGQQARLTKKGELTIQAENQLQDDVAWKNNQFAFHDTPLKEVMQKISCWYDVQVSFDCCKSTPYTLTLSRDITLSELLKNMEKMGDFKFIRISKEKRIIVKGK